MNIKFNGLYLSVGVFLMLLPGCYTQLSTTRDDDREDDRAYSSRELNDEDTSGVENQDDAYDNGYRYDNYYDESWHHRGQIGFSYYYPTYWPSTYFAAAYSDPWYFGLGCDPYYFGSPYYYYPRAAYYSPWYSYYNPYYYYGYGGYYGYGSNRYSAYKPSIRTFGSERTGSGGRPVTGGRDIAPADRSSAGTGDGNLPIGADVRGCAAQPPRKPDAKSAPRDAGNVRVTTPRRGSDRSSGRVDRGSRNTGSRGSITRGSSPRDAQPVYRPPEGRPSKPPSASSPPRRDGGTQYTPPPARSGGSAPRSSPPPSGSGSQPSRGGSSRVRP